MVVDLGKVVHYSFDKITHESTPTEKGSSDNFEIL